MVQATVPAGLRGVDGDRRRRGSQSGAERDGTVVAWGQRDGQTGCRRG